MLMILSVLIEAPTVYNTLSCTSADLRERMPIISIIMFVLVEGFLLCVSVCEFVYVCVRPRTQKTRVCVCMCSVQNSVYCSMAKLGVKPLTP